MGGVEESMACELGVKYTDAFTLGTEGNRAANSSGRIFFGFSEAEIRDFDEECFEIFVQSPFTPSHSTWQERGSAAPLKDPGGPGSAVGLARRRRKSTILLLFRKFCSISTSRPPAPPTEAGESADVHHP